MVCGLPPGGPVRDAAGGWRTRPTVIAVCSHSAYGVDRFLGGCRTKLRLPTVPDLSLCPSDVSFSFKSLKNETTVV